MCVRRALTERLELGLKRYNHGVRVNDDTQSWGTPKNSWIEMAREELLDSIIYIVADYIRSVRLMGEMAPTSFRQNDEPDDNKLIMSIVDEWNDIESPQHRMLLWNIFKMLNSELFKSVD